MSKKRKVNKFSGKVAADTARQKSTGSNYGYLRLPKGISIFSPEPGKRSSFDVLPYWVTNPKHPDRNDSIEIAVPGTLWYKRPFRVHRDVGIGKEAVVCLSSFGKKCPICDYRYAQQKAGASKEELKVLNSKQRNLYCIIPIGSKTHEAVPHIFDISQFLYQDKVNQETEENSDYDTYMDLEDGLTVDVRWLSTTMGTGKPFAQAGRIDFKQREEQYDESILKNIPDLDKLLIELSYKEMETKFMELEGEVELSEEEDSDEDEADDDDDVPVRKKKVVEPVKSTTKPKPVVEEDEDDDEEEEPAPVRKKKPAPEPEKPKRKPVVVEEDEDDDEEEEEKPAPTKLKRKPVVVVEEEEDEDEEEEPFEADEDEDEEEEAPVVKKPLARSVPASKDKKRASVSKVDPIICIACQGTGKNSRGKTCPVCKGTGMKPNPDIYMEEDDD